MVARNVALPKQFNYRGKVQDLHERVPLQSWEGGQSHQRIQDMRLATHQQAL